MSLRYGLIQILLKHDKLQTKELRIQAFENLILVIKDLQGSATKNKLMLKGYNIYDEYYKIYQTLFNQIFTENLDNKNDIYQELDKFCEVKTHQDIFYFYKGNLFSCHDEHKQKVVNYLLQKLLKSQSLLSIENFLELELLDKNIDTSLRYKLLAKYLLKYKEKLINFPKLKNLINILDRNFLLHDELKLFITYLIENTKNLISATNSLKDLENLLYLYIKLNIKLEKEDLIQILKSVSQKSEVDQISKTKSPDQVIYENSQILNYVSSLTDVTCEIFSEISEKLEHLEKDISYKTSGYYLNSILNLLLVWLYSNSKNTDHEKLKILIEKLNILNINEIPDANRVFFLLKNILVFLESKDDLLVQTITGILAKLPLSEYKKKQEGESITQNKIAKILMKMGYFFKEECVIGIYSLDYFLKPNLIVEYHGVTHYYYGTHELMKDNLLKQIYFKKLGYRYIIIPYYNWHLLESTERQEKYLKNLIESFEY